MIQLWKFQSLILFLIIKKKFNSNKINFNLLNNLNFTDLDLKRYPAIKLLKKYQKIFFI